MKSNDQQPIAPDNRLVKEKDLEDFNSLRKDEIWHKWQSDKNILKMYMQAMAHYGVTKFDDVKAVAELQVENNKPWDVAKWQSKQQPINEDEKINKVIRVEVIDSKGRSYINWDDKNKVELSCQDEGKTLKIFITHKL